MRDLINIAQNLFEAKRFEISVRGSMVTVYENPSRAEFWRLLEKYGELRGVLSDKLIVWDAGAAIHNDIYNETGDLGEALVLHPDCVEIGSWEQDVSEEEDEEAVEWAQHNIILNRLYGDDLNVVSRFTG